MVINEEVPLVESMPICEYLDEVAPDPRLLPRDIVLKAQVRGFCEIVNSGIQPMQNMNMLAKLKETGGNPHEWARFWIMKGLGGRIFQILV